MNKILLTLAGIALVASCSDRIYMNPSDFAIYKNMTGTDGHLLFEVNGGIYTFTDNVLYAWPEAMVWVWTSNSILFILLSIFKGRKDSNYFQDLFSHLIFR